VSSIDAVTLAAAVGGSCAAALAGWAAPDRRTSHDQRVSRRRRGAVMTIVVAGAAAASVTAPVVSVFWALLALNFTLGRRENVPFSTYPMFSNPDTTAWSLRFEDPNGQAVKIGKIGLAPHIVRKRFATELRTARRRGNGDESAARQVAAEVLATLIEEHRPPGGPLAASPITIVLVEYILESGRLRTVKTPIIETSPR